MATDDDQDQTCPEKLAEAVIRRRDSQGLTQAQVGSRGGPSTETMRLIEGARRTAYGSATLLRLDRALGWRDGTSARVLAGTATEDAPGRREHGPPPGPHDSASGERGAEPSGHAWAELGRLVKARREAMKLRQSDLESRGGPSSGTVRNIEQAARTKYASRTFTQLEVALSWSPGAVARILDGTATADDLNPTRHPTAPSPSPTPAARNTRPGDDATFPTGTVLDCAAAFQALCRAVAEATADLADLVAAVEHWQANERRSDRGR